MILDHFHLHRYHVHVHHHGHHEMKRKWAVQIPKVATYQKQIPGESEFYWILVKPSPRGLSNFPEAHQGMERPRGCRRSSGKGAMASCAEIIPNSLTPNTEGFSAPCFWMMPHDVTWPYCRCFKYLHIFKSIQLKLPLFLTKAVFSTTRQPPEERHPGLWMPGGTLLARELESGTQACSVIFKLDDGLQQRQKCSYICVHIFLVLLSLRLHRNGVLHHHASYLCQLVMSINIIYDIL